MTSSSAQHQPDIASFHNGNVDGNADNEEVSINIKYNVG